MAAKKSLNENTFLSATDMLHNLHSSYVCHRQGIVPVSAIKYEEQIKTYEP